MPRACRVNENGFYHVLNRGVAKSSIFHEEKDFKKFLEIMQEASDEYGFEIYSLCLMNNHYHLLVKIKQHNLSLSLQKINSRYSIYFNKKYKRVGPLWQGRFKSWYIYDSFYLQILVKYIEQNPIKAGIVKNISGYKWVTSSLKTCYGMLNYTLIKSIDLTKELSQKELERVDEFYHSSQKNKQEETEKLEQKPLKSFFTKNSDKEMHQALKEGYSATSIANYLSLSNASITKKMKRYRQKVALFQKLKQKGIFWSFNKGIAYENFSDELLIEYTLKYADFDDMKTLVSIFGKNQIKRVWKKQMESDRSFIKTNVLIARVLFGMDVDGEHFRKAKNERLEKLKLLAR